MADKHVERARKLLAENRATEASMEVRLALELMTTHAEAMLMNKAAESRIRQCEDVLKLAKEALVAEDWRSALRR